MLNRIIIMGRLVKDPELRMTNSGAKVTTITVAVDRDFQAKDSAEKQTDFIDVVAWQQRAEFICNFFTKGRMIVVEGSLQSRKWQDKNEQNRVSWEVVASNVYFGDNKRDDSSAGGFPAPARGNGSAESYSAPENKGSFAEIEDDGELPF